MLDTTLSALGGPICSWTDAAKAYALHFSPEVLGQMFEKAPRSGLEIGGLLVGRVETEGNLTTFWVEGFRPVESEHRWGSSYLLSDPDFARLRAEMDRCGSRCLGIYRSQTRARKLALDVSDVKVFGQCFRTGNALFLMLAPALGKAAFFSRADADLKCVREFGLPAPGTLRLRRDRLHNRPVRSSSAPAADVPAKLGAKAKTRSWYSAALIAILVSGSGAIGLAGYLAHRAERGSAGPMVLDLKIQPFGSSLHVRWDPNSPALRGAARVVLHIQDGDYRSDRDLAPSEVRSGSTTYESRSDEVFLRIDAYSTAPSAIGSVRVIGSPARAATSVTPAPTLVRPATNVPPAPAPVRAFSPAASPIRQVPKDPNATKTWLGMSLKNVTRDVALAFHLPQPSGLLVTKVDVWSPAGTSGLESGDILLAFDGQRIADNEELQLKIREMTRGRTATLAVFRDGAIQQIEVNVGEAPGRVAQSAAVAAQR
jgi:hypothetical protein